MFSYFYFCEYGCVHPSPGATQQQLIEGAEHASGGQVVGRFFALHPPRRLQLVPWLASWISRGAVPVATMNMQQGVHEGEEIPDAWHHQLVFGVGPSAVYMTNPLDVGECLCGQVRSAPLGYLPPIQFPGFL